MLIDYRIYGRPEAYPETFDFDPVKHKKLNSWHVHQIYQFIKDGYTNEDLARAFHVPVNVIVGMRNFRTNKDWEWTFHTGMRPNKDVLARNTLLRRDRTYLGTTDLGIHVFSTNKGVHREEMMKIYNTFYRDNYFYRSEFIYNDENIIGNRIFGMLGENIQLMDYELYIPIPVREPLGF